MEDLIFTSNEISQFKEDGYLHLQGAFPCDSALAMQDFMWTQLKQLKGIDRADKSTWSIRWSGLNKTANHGIYKAVNSPRMIKAIHQLLGPGDWNPPGGRGGFLVSFPESSDASWDIIDRGWHWDGHPQMYNASQPSLMLFTFYSQVIATGGGTLIVAGSHRLVMQFFDTLEPSHGTRKQKPLKQRFAKSYPWFAELTGTVPSKDDRIQRFMEKATVINHVPVRVVELTGEPGDAVFCHPAIFHATSYNRAEVPRFMRVCVVDERKQIPNQKKRSVST